LLKKQEEDPRWTTVKKEVDLRDKHQCQFQRCISVTESHQLLSVGPKSIDRCHIFSRSSYPKLIYNKNNIISLSRYIHERMDNYRSPLNGDFIDENVHWYWWWRIFNHKIEKYNEEIIYEEILYKELF
jgi:5-methylcytosine-specific restriction endonuclease McrA